MLRWRPYFYAPPNGWQPVARSSSTLWLAPDCARRHATLKVFHARPARASTGTLQHRRLFEQLSLEYAAHRPEEPRAVENDHQMSGQATTQRGIVGGEPMLATTVSLSDGRMIYLARLEAIVEVHDEHLPVLMPLAKTMRPVPVATTDIDVLIDWVD